MLGLQRRKEAAPDAKPSSNQSVFLSRERRSSGLSRYLGSRHPIPRRGCRDAESVVERCVARTVNVTGRIVDGLRLMIRTSKGAIHGNFDSSDMATSSDRILLAVNDRGARCASIEET